MSNVRISGYFKPDPIEGAYVIARLISKAAEIDSEAEFIIDTGASKTIISDRDALWMGINYDGLKKVRPSVGIGGTVQTFAIGGAELVFKTDGDGILSIRFDNIYVMKHRKANRTTMRIPSILGRDFLNRFTLIYSYKSGRIMVTDEELGKRG